MERIPPELIYVLIFVGIMLFNFVMQRAAKRRQEEAPPEEQTAQNQPLEEVFGRRQPQTQEPPEEVFGRRQPPAQEPLEEVFGRRQPVSAVQAPPAAPPPRVRPREAVAPPALRRRANAFRSLLSDKGDLRRAVVIMTVLGPCRALEETPARGQEDERR